MNRECAHHYWCTLGKLCKSGEINLPLLDLNSLPLVFVLIVLVRALTTTWLSSLRAVPSKVSRTLTNKAIYCLDELAVEQSALGQSAEEQGNVRLPADVEA